MLTRRTFVASASASLLAGPALAQTAYPDADRSASSSAIPPGGGVDIVARLMAIRSRTRSARP